GAAPGDPYAAPPAPRSYLALLDEPPPRLRIAVFDGALFGSRIHPRCAAAVHEAAELLSGLGHEVEPAAPEIDRAALVRAYFAIIATGTTRVLERIRATTGKPLDREQLETVTWFLHQLGRKLRASELLAAIEEAHRASRRLATFHQRYDVLLTSTLG